MSKISLNKEDTVVVCCLQLLSLWLSLSLIRFNFTIFFTGTFFLLPYVVVISAASKCADIETSLLILIFILKVLE